VSTKLQWSCPGFDDTWTLPVASQGNSKRGGLVVLAKSNIAGRLIAGAILSVPNASKTYRFKSVRKTLVAGVKTSANPIGEARWRTNIARSPTPRGGTT
jgi:hypothetical protein